MLKEIFRTVLLPYAQLGDPTYGGSGIYNGSIPNPYVEKLQDIWGLTVSLQPLPTSPESIYVWMTMARKQWPSFSFAYYRFNATDGQFIDRIGDSVSGQSLFLAGGTTTARSGALWFRHIYGTQIVKVQLGVSATLLVGDEDKQPDSWAPILDSEVSIGDFSGDPNGDPNSFSPAYAVDDSKVAGGGYLLNCSSGKIHVYRWTDGTHVHTFTVPSQPVALALEDSGRAYVLAENRVLYLLDYARGEILGASKIPGPREQPSYAIGTRMCWDPVYRRVLIFEKTTDDVDGGSTLRVRGYRQVPEPVRLTTPIPLKAPRQRRTIPVLVQALGDLNEGVGAYVLEATVTGSGSLVGFPISDGMGNTILQVALEGSRSFDGPSDWEITGSPEADPIHTGLVNITVTAQIYSPDPADIPVSGVEGSGGGGLAGASGPGSGQNRYIWAWSETNPAQPAPDAPGSQPGAPTTMQEWQDYFFEIAERTIGTSANDYQAVLLSLRDQGMHVNPTPGEVPQVSWEFYGMSVMIDGGGYPRGRIWLPTATPDSNGYYTHEIQVIADDPNAGTGEAAPNMYAIVVDVYNSRTWRLAEAYEDELDGRGAFTEACATAMHDQDAHFGHVTKTPGQNQYNGHAVDAVNYLNDDGTGEVYIIVTTSGEICWRFEDRSTYNGSHWHYPA